MLFLSVDVVKTVENTFYVEWDMRANNPPETVGDWRFRILWSRDINDGFTYILDSNNVPIEIDGTVGPLSYTHNLIQYDFNIDQYYQVQALLKTNPATNFYSTKVFVGIAGQGVHETIRYAESLLYKNWTGEPCVVMKRKTLGTPCTRCWSPERQQRLYSHCDVCNGSGIVDGYYAGTKVQIAFDANPRKNDSQKEFDDVYNTVRARLSNYPLLRTKDLIFNADSAERYVVLHNDITKLPNLSENKQKLSGNNYIISQILTLQQLNPDDDQYNVSTGV